MKTARSFRNLTPEERTLMEKQGCRSESWDLVKVSDGFDAQRFHRVSFSGEIFLGSTRGYVELSEGYHRPSGIEDASISHCIIGDEVLIHGIRNYMVHYEVGDRAVIQNCDLIIKEGHSRFGNGTRVAVLNEAGGRELPIFNRLSAPLAYIMVFYRHRPRVIETLNNLISDFSESMATEKGIIGEHSRVQNCHLIRNVYIGQYAEIEGADHLEEGSINSNVFDPVKVGSGVSAKEFVFSSGSEITSSVFLEKCFVGQGVVLGKQYSAENSLFFANCAGFHGEACSIFAGPFTVTHHKSTLLIAAYYSFLNAGSGSNQSNHMYKLGPIHQGIIERGSKTTSDSYLLWPARVGPFTLVMGRHYKNSDTSNLPFSYLIESNDESILAPGVNLRSVGTIRDAQKWPKRDKRKDPDLLDLINYNLLSPYTIQKMWRGREILRNLEATSGAKSDFYSYENTRIPRSALQRGIQMYTMGIHKFLGNSLISRIEKLEGNRMEDLHRQLDPVVQGGAGNWIDLAGLIAPQELVDALLNDIESGKVNDLATIEKRFAAWNEQYYALEWTWAREKLEQEFGKRMSDLTCDDVLAIVQSWGKAVISLDEMLYDDARKEFRLSAQTGFGADGGEKEKYLDFEQVRGVFEQNPAVMAIREHIQRKTGLAERITLKLGELQE